MHEFVLSASPLNIKVNQPGMLVLEFQLDSVLVINDSLIITKPGLPLDQSPGYPALPCLSEVIVGLPPTAQMEVFTDQAIIVPGFLPGRVAPEQAKGIDFTIPITNWDGSDYPDRVASTMPAGKIRGHVSTALKIYPVRFVVGNLVRHQRITVKLTWNRTTTINPQLLSQTSLSELPVTEMPHALHRRIILPDYQYSGNIAKIMLDKTGWYQLSQPTLVDSGLMITNVDPRTFRLWSQNQEILIYVEGESDGHFNTSDRIIFFGEKNKAPINTPYRSNFYTDTNVYWLTWGAVNGIRYISESAYPDLPTDQVLVPLSFIHTQHYEQDDYFARLGSMHTHDQWDTFDHFFMEPAINGGTSEQFEIELYSPRNTNTVEFRVGMEFQGVTDGNHTLQAFINGYKVTEAAWSGQASQQITEDPGQVLQNDFLKHGSNQLLITLEGNDPTNRYDQVYLNWVDITYDRLYQANNDRLVFTRDSNLPITTQFEVFGFTDNSILVFKEGISRIQDFIVVYDTGPDHYKIVFQDYLTSNATRYHCLIEDSLQTVKSVHSVEPILSPLSQGGADYLVLMPDSFQTILQPLIDLHDGIGVDIDDVYRQYSGGVLSPYAIRDFLTDVYYSWSPVPSEVLIAMQGGLFGWRGGYSKPGTYIPSMKTQTYGWGAASSDFWYTLVAGDDLIPEFSIGRLPAQNQAELEIMVAKAHALQNQLPETWKNQVLMIAGYEEAFKLQSEALIQNIVSQAIFPTRLNIDQYSESSPFYGSTDTLLKHFADGRVYINFLGHGGGAVWGDRSLFTLGDIDNLLNPGKTPFVTSMTCFTGDVTNPNALGRRLLGYDQGGVASWFGSAGVGWIINDYLLLQPIHQRLFNSPELSIGEIINQAKIQYLATNSAYPDIAQTQVMQFNLSGDPATRLHLPQINPVQLNFSDPEPGETIAIILPGENIDSVRIQLFNDSQIPTTRYPKLLMPSANSYNYQLPLNSEPGPHNLIISWMDNETVYRTCQPLSISGADVIIKEIIPRDPNYLDSIQVIIQARDRQGIDSVQLLIHNNFYADLVQAGDELYRSSTPIPPRIAGSILALKGRVVDSTGHESFSQELQVAIRDLPDFTLNDIKQVADNTIKLVCTVNNNSSGSGNAIVLFERKASNNWVELGADTIAFSGRGSLLAELSSTLPSGVHQYRATVKSEYPGSSIDTTISTLETSAFWVTPQLGTTSDRQTHSTVYSYGIYLEAPPGSATSDVILQIKNYTHSIPDNQPDLKLVAVDSIRDGIEVSIPAPVSINVTWNPGIALPDTTSLYQYYPDREIWLPVISFTTQDSSISFSSTAPGNWAFFTSTDIIAPRLEATINGQRFLHDSYLNSNPVISLIGFDENGIDHRSSGLQAWINDQQLINHQFSIMSGKCNQLGIQFTPTLTAFDTSMAIVMCDASGNLSDTLKLKFIVSPKLNLIDYGNFPNPFTDQTRFAYELTENVDEFSLDIYTVDGRRIRHLTQESTLTDLDPRAGAYHEILWDGRDKNGDFVANGVYFYQLKITKDKTTIKRQGKLAKAR